jgi:hypothetical protein
MQGESGAEGESPKKRHRTVHDVADVLNADEIEVLWVLEKPPEVPVGIQSLEGKCFNLDGKEWRVVNSSFDAESSCFVTFYYDIQVYLTTKWASPMPYFSLITFLPQL